MIILEVLGTNKIQLEVEQDQSHKNYNNKLTKTKATSFIPPNLILIN